MCGSAARTDLYGGRSVMTVPTVTEHIDVRGGNTLLPGRDRSGLRDRSSGFAIGVDRSRVAFRGFLPRKTTPRDL